jgi:murein DD-endopeptidase MepM/ murein hydrolase activator NlpD
MVRRRYYLDSESLQYRRVRFSVRQKFSRSIKFILISVPVAAFWIVIFLLLTGSPKERYLQSEVENLKLRYSLLFSDFEKAETILGDIASSEDNIYRPVLDLPLLTESFRESGFGGTSKYDEMEGYDYSDLMISASSRLNSLIRRTYVQSKSFEEIIPEASDWKKRVDHLPYIMPVRVNISLGEGVRFRESHPVLGVPRWHHGQDFYAPPGTKVYATGNGVVTKASWNPHGFGNRIEIDHGYGFTSIYGHLSGFNVEVGDSVRRGHLIGFSGNTGISSGPHLHYEIHYNGLVQNPLYFFDDDLSLEEFYEMISAVAESDSLYEDGV